VYDQALLLVSVLSFLCFVFWFSCFFMFRLFILFFRRFVFLRSGLRGCLFILMQSRHQRFTGNDFAIKTADSAGRDVDIGQKMTMNVTIAFCPSMAAAISPYMRRHLFGGGRLTLRLRLTVRGSCFKVQRSKFTVTLIGSWLHHLR
jgi:hypothetical protein